MSISIYVLINVSGTNEGPRLIQHAPATEPLSQDLGRLTPRFSQSNEKDPSLARKAPPINPINVYDLMTIFLIEWTFSDRPLWFYSVNQYPVAPVVQQYTTDRDW